MAEKFQNGELQEDVRQKLNRNADEVDGIKGSINTVSSDLSVVKSEYIKNGLNGTKPETSGGIKNLKGGNLDALRGPYPTIAAANLAIPNITVQGINLREGKFVEIGAVANGFVTYWWFKGYHDGALVPYVIGMKKEINSSEGEVFGGLSNITFSASTGILNCTSLLTYYNPNGQRRFLSSPAGAATSLLTVFRTVPDEAANSTTWLVYFDFDPSISLGTVVLSTALFTAVPEIPFGFNRIFIGRTFKNSNGAFEFYSHVLQVWKELTVVYKKPIQILAEKVAADYPALKKEITSSDGYVRADLSTISFSFATGILNSTSLVTYFSANGRRRFLVNDEGVANFRITNFKTISDGAANSTYHCVYFDFNPIQADGNATLMTARKDTMPDIAAGYSRIMLGMAFKNSTGTFEFKSEKLQLYKEAGVNITPLQNILDGGGAITLSNRQKVYQPWFNKFPNALDKCPKFTKKVLDQLDDVNILMLGDSLFGKQDGSTLFADILNLPNGCSRNHVQFQLWNYLVKNKPLSNRFNTIEVFPDVFSYTGSWSVLTDDKFNTPGWAGEFHTDVATIRMSNSAGASVSGSWTLAAYEKLNVIYKKTIDGSSAVTLNISIGNGAVQVYDNTASNWIEANGYTFSQKTQQLAQGSGYAWHMSDVKLRLRRVATTGIAVISLTKDSNTSEFLYFWGSERWNGPTIFITNIARGGRTVQLLQNQFLNDVIDRKPDLVLFELPMTNEFSNFARTGYQTILNHIQDFIWGDRAGATTTLSLKNRSNDWQNFEILAFIPHYRGAYFDGDKPLNYALDTDLSTIIYTADSTPYSTNQRVKSLIRSKGDINVIDMGDVFIAEAKNLGWTIQQSVTGSAPASDQSFTTTNDNVHTNDFGAYVWAKIIAGVLGSIN